MMQMPQQLQNQRQSERTTSLIYFGEHMQRFFYDDQFSRVLLVLSKMGKSLYYCLLVVFSIQASLNVWTLFVCSLGTISDIRKTLASLMKRLVNHSLFCGDCYH